MKFPISFYQTLFFLKNLIKYKGGANIQNTVINSITIKEINLSSGYKLGLNNLNLIQLIKKDIENKEYIIIKTLNASRLSRFIKLYI